MSRRYLLLFVLILALAVPAFANHSWGGYHWARTSNPFALKVGDNVSSQWDAILNTTISDWSKSTVCDLTKVAGQATGRCRGTSGRDEVCDGTYGNNGWLGVASISITGGTHITLGTVKLNDTYFNTSKYNTTPWRNLVSCEEVGHTLGLDHQDTNFNNEEHTSELQSPYDLVCRLLLEKKKKNIKNITIIKFKNTQKEKNKINNKNINKMNSLELDKLLLQ